MFYLVEIKKILGLKITFPDKLKMSRNIKSKVDNTYRSTVRSMEV